MSAYASIGEILYLVEGKVLTLFQTRTEYFTFRMTEQKDTAKNI